jgi:hypothetical protein
MSTRQLLGRKRHQSNADEANPKRSKTTNKDDSEEEPEGSVEVQPPVKKVSTKGKGKKGKKPRCVAYHDPYEGLPTNSPSIG